MLATNEGLLGPVPADEKKEGGGFLQRHLWHSKQTVWRPRLQAEPGVTCYACLCSCGGQPSGQPVVHGDVLALRFNHQGGACLRAQSCEPGESGELGRFICEGKQIDAACHVIVASPSGKPSGAPLSVGDWVSLQLPTGIPLCLVQHGDHTELQAIPDGVPAVFVLSEVPRPPAPAAPPATQPAAQSQDQVQGDGSEELFAGMVAAGLTVKTAGSTDDAAMNKAALAAAPHVTRAVQKRYSGAEGRQRMQSDAATAAAHAQTAYEVGKRVSENPAARAAASSLFSAATKGAVAAMNSKR